MGNGGEDAEHIYIRDRKGFVKLALRAGADLVPTYVYGERQRAEAEAERGQSEGRRVKSVE